MIEEAPNVRRIYAGVFLTSMATLMLEVTLTRIFSVTMWYHFAFVAVSLAMFGLAAGGMLNYILGDKLDRARVPSWLGAGGLALAWSIPAAYLWHLGVPLVFRPSFPGLINLLFAYAGLAVPFVISGFLISLALTSYPAWAGKIYRSDLVGAGLACLLVVGLMHVMSAHQVILVTALAALAASHAFAPDAGERGKRRVTAIVLVVALALNAWLGFLEPDLLKGGVEAKPEFIAWNSFSRVMAAPFGEPDKPVKPFGWGMSDLCPYYEPGRKMTNIDAAAATPIIKFDGDIGKHEYLAWDITNLVHHVKHDADVLIIGVGGGRDVLSAMYFGQRSITGVEINPIFRRLSLKIYPEFSGALYSGQRPSVRTVTDEGRSFLQKTGESYDIVQMSLVDTWAATAAGAYVLTENNLYTVEAFGDVYERLKPGGIYSISRYIYKPDNQTLRVAALARAMFEERGIADFDRSILIVENLSEKAKPVGTSSVLIKRGAFTEEEIAAVEAVCDEMGFTPVYLPGRGDNDKIFADLIETKDPGSFYDNYIYDVRPTRDDSPFFFHCIKPVDIWRTGFGMLRRPSYQGQIFNLKAVFILFGLLLVSAFLCLVFVFGPLWIKRASAAAERRTGYLAFFCCLGLGFMLVEIPLLQRFILLLGHPVYALTVILFSLLLFSGVGSGLSSRFVGNPRRALRLALLGLIVLLPLYIWLLPGMIYALISWPTASKAAIAVISLAPVGLLMGMPFPIGVTIMSRRSAGLIPWAWAVNGAAGVLASVLAVVVALMTSFSTALACGMACYVLALLTSLSFPAAEER